MLDENIWLQLNDEEKIAEIQIYLNQYLSIETRNHELSNQPNQGKLVSIKKELETKIFKILEIENAS
jgi:hypothetical protein